MKNIKKIGLVCLIVLILSALLIVLTGCSKDNNEGSNDNSKKETVVSKSLKSSNLSIDDYKWETNLIKHNGTDCYALSLTNNSNYDIISVRFIYKVKDSVSNEELNVYNEFMKSHDGYIKEDDSPKNITLIGFVDKLVEKGETNSDLRFTIGYNNSSWYSYPNEEQFNLMEPKQLEIGIVGENNKLYMAYYDFVKSNWMLDDKTVDADVWSDNELAKKIEKPLEKHHIIEKDSTEEFKICSYGITEETYNAYKEKIESSGYTASTSNSTWFEAKNSDNHKITIYYYKDEARMSISSSQK